MTVGFKVVNAAGVLMADEQGLVQVAQTLASVNLAISATRSVSLPPAYADVSPPYTAPLIAITGTSASFTLVREATVHVWAQAGILNTSATAASQAFRPGYVGSTGPTDVGRHDWRIAADLVRNLLMWRFDRLSAGTYTVGLLGWTGNTRAWETALLYNFDMAVMAMGI